MKTVYFIIFVCVLSLNLFADGFNDGGGGSSFNGIIDNSVGTNVAASGVFSGTISNMSVLSSSPLIYKKPAGIAIWGDNYYWNVGDGSFSLVSSLSSNLFTFSRDGVGNYGLVFLTSISLGANMNGAGYSMTNLGTVQATAFAGDGSRITNAPQSIFQLIRQKRTGVYNIKPALNATRPWVTLSNYYVGEVVSNAGNAYICAVQGASGATGPTGTGLTNIIDGTVAWQLYGPAEAGTDNSITWGVTSTVAVAGYTNQTTISNSPPVLNYFGGNLYTAFPWIVSSRTNTSTTAPNRMSFNTDAKQLYIYALNSQRTAGVNVDGAPLVPGGISCALRSYITITFPYKGDHRIDVLGGYDVNYKDVFCDNTGTIWSVPHTNYLRCAVFGDSITIGISGAGPFENRDFWTSYLGEYFGWDMWNCGIGGTGWTNATTHPNFWEHETDLTNGFDVVLCSGGYNDATTNGIPEAVTSWILNARTLNPVVNAPIFIGGVWQGGTGLNASKELLVSNGVAAAQAQIPYVYWIPFINTASPWLTGQGNISNIVSGNVSSYIWNDNTHPINLGHKYIAHRWIKAIDEIVNKQP